MHSSGSSGSRTVGVDLGRPLLERLAGQEWGEAIYKDKLDPAGHSPPGVSEKQRGAGRLCRSRASPAPRRREARDAQDDWRLGGVVVVRGRGRRRVLTCFLFPLAV